MKCATQPKHNSSTAAGLHALVRVLWNQGERLSAAISSLSKVADKVLRAISYLSKTFDELAETTSSLPEAFDKKGMRRFPFPAQMPERHSYFK